MTDRFVVKVDLTFTDAGTMRTFASVVRFVEIADVQATSEDRQGSVPVQLGNADVTLPLTLAPWLASVRIVMESISIALPEPLWRVISTSVTGLSDRPVFGFSG